MEAQTEVREAAYVWDVFLANAFPEQLNKKNPWKGEWIAEEVQEGVKGSEERWKSAWRGVIMYIFVSTWELLEFKHWITLLSGAILSVQ